MSNKSKAASSKEIYKSFQVRYVGLQGVASLIEVALGNPKTFMQDAANQLDASRYHLTFVFLESVFHYLTRICLESDFYYWTLIFLRATFII